MGEGADPACSAPIGCWSEMLQARRSDGRQFRIGAVTSENFLQRLAAEDRAALEARLIVHNCAQGEIVISHLDQDRDVFFVLEGRVRATLYSRSGREVDYRDIGPGDAIPG